ncbi:MAG: type II secretion system protein [Calothrix sp. CSU_2_0]|nr:type II secretion system protein [Calothrix sp. CSU_2_0]
MIHCKKKQKLTSNDSGFTIIESLMAIIVVSILMIAIAPAIVLSVATRVQAKRVELATDAASSYVDAVRSTTIDPPPITKRATGATTDPAPPDAPSGTLKCEYSSKYCDLPVTNPSTSSLFCVNGDTKEGCQNTSNKDMVVQAFGYHPTSTTPENGYKLGVRVYRADAFKTGITLQAVKDGAKSQKAFGTNLLSKNKPQPPLIEFTTEVTAKGTSFSDLCGRLEEKDSSGKNINLQSKC